jgi:hypothetical protein
MLYFTIAKTFQHLLDLISQIYCDPRRRCRQLFVSFVRHPFVSILAFVSLDKLPAIPTNC